MASLKAILVTSKEPAMKQDYAEKGIMQVLLDLIAN